MTHRRWSVPGWLLAIAAALMLAVHVLLLLRASSLVTITGAFGIAALVPVLMHLGLAAWSRYKRWTPG